MPNSNSNTTRGGPLLSSLSIQDKSIPAGAAMAELRQVPQATDLDGLIGGWDGLCGHPEHSGTVH